MARKQNGAGFKQMYSTNRNNASSAGRANQSQQTSVNGRYYGSRQAQSLTSGGAVGRKGLYISRNKQAYDIKRGEFVAGTRAYQMAVDAGWIRPSANGTRTARLANSAG